MPIVPNTGGKVALDDVIGATYSSLNPGAPPPRHHSPERRVQRRVTRLSRLRDRALSSIIGAMNETPETALDEDPALTAFVNDLMPFGAVIGLKVVSNAADKSVGIADWAPERCTVGTALHGGYLMALADSMGAVCAFANLPAGAAGTSTIESKTNFLRAATEGPITIVSTPIHVGRTTIVVQTDILRPDGKIVTRTTQTQAVLQG